VVEDIPLFNERFWQIAGLVLGAQFGCHIVRCRESYIFVCRRSADA
jgi:hypothetical protein